METAALPALTPGVLPALTQGLMALGVIVALLTSATARAQDVTETDPATEQDQGVRWELYGRLKADASLDSALVDPGNFARWVESPELAENHSHFNMTVRETRLGLHVHAPPGGPTISGHVEIDFYGGGAENRNVVMLRHAHIDVVWDSGWSLIAGQYSDVISPLAPTTVNYSVAWWVGNIGYRRPQLRATKRFGSSRSALVLTGAVSRTIGDDFAQEPGDSGVDSGRPTVQGRAAWEWDSGGRRAGIGISGHQGVEDLHADFPGSGLEYASWSVGVDVLVPLADRWLFKGEAWTGANLDDYLGGIGQGINLDARTDIRARGGWASIEFRASELLLLSAGGGIDDPRDEDLASNDTLVRTLNRVFWANAIVDLGRGLSTGLEVSHWHTEHGDQRPGEALRGQAALIFNF